MQWNSGLTRILVFVAVLAAVVVALPFVAAGDDEVELDGLSSLDVRVLYRLERDGAVVGFFTECSGIGSENEVVEFRDGTSDIVTKIPGRLKWENIVLKRGITSDLQIWNWREEVVRGEAPRSALTITMLRRRIGPVAVWHFQNAWPSKITGPQPKSDDNSFGVEEVTIVHEGMQRAT